MPRQDVTIAGQGAIGLGLALGVVAAWLVIHVVSIFIIDWSMPSTLILAPLAVGVECWLSVGLFIIAHDAMHGSLVPGRASANHAIGQLALTLYAGFSFRGLMAKHHEHHDHAGTTDDPDFDPQLPQRFWRWFWRFIGTYFGWREWLMITCMFVSYLILTGADPISLLAFWGLPSMLASLQLFYFGTYLPHRAGPAEFSDRHRTRSNHYSWLVSLITCFHFGYHHEHHEYPYLPWWRLPAAHFGGASELIEGGRQV